MINDKADNVNIIHSREQLLSTMKSCGENIVYGAGSMAHFLCRYLLYTGNQNLVLCAAVEDDIVNPNEVYETPVVAIRFLVHFYSTANFYLAVSNGIQKDIDEGLRLLGCRNIYRIDEKVFQDIEHCFANISDNVVTAYANEITKTRINSVANAIKWQAEIKKTNSESFGEFRGVNEGRDIVLLATGPTSGKYKWIDNAKHLAVNTAVFLGENIDYFFAHDKRAFIKKTIDSAISKCQGDVFIGKIAGTSPYVRCEINLGSISGIGNNVHRFFCNTPDMKADLIENICMHPLTDYFSIVFPAIQFALYTHPRKIFLVGCDVSGKLEHFNERSNIIVPHAKYFKLGYGLLKRFAEIYYPDVEIVSINPVGLKGLFEDYYSEII